MRGVLGRLEDYDKMFLRHGFHPEDDEPIDSKSLLFLVCQAFEKEKVERRLSTSLDEIVCFDFGTLQRGRWVYRETKDNERNRNRNT